MELRQLRYFAAVAEELHFARAAQRLHISQAPLSAAVQKLEKELGHQLFYRTTRRVSLTPMGEELHRRAAVLLEQAEGLTTDLELVAEGRAGRLRVGFVSSASYALLPRAIRRFRELAPQVALHPEPMTSAEQAERLREGSLDLGIVRGTGGAPGLEVEEVFNEEIVACLPGDHPLAADVQPDPEALTREPLIFFPEREMPGYAAEIRPIFRGMPFPAIYARIIQQETALGFVAAGLGFTLLPASVSHFAPRSIQVSAIAGGPRTAVCAALPEAPLSPAAQLFLDVLREIGPELASHSTTHSPPSPDSEQPVG